MLTPGASTAIVLRNSIHGGTRAGLITAVGSNIGSLCYGLLTAFGFAAALQRWPSAWTGLRTAGVLYMAWLGMQSLRRSAAPTAPLVVVAPGERTAGAWTHLSEGFVTNALNPAIATFYLVLLPQFIPRDAPVTGSALVLTGIHISLAASWHVMWAAAGGTLARFLSGGYLRRALEAITGATLLALATKIALG